MQLKEKKPYKTFTRLAGKYGPIYSTRTGAFTVIVVNSIHAAKEDMVTRFSSMSNKQISTALKTLTFDKCMVAAGDYIEFHKMIKKHIIISNVLGANARIHKRHCPLREAMMENISTQFNEHVKSSSTSAVNFRKIFASELFGLALKQSMGSNVESIDVERLGGSLSKDDIYRIQWKVQLRCQVDWRDFFPNKTLEKYRSNLHFGGNVVMEDLIDEQKKRIISGKDRLHEEIQKSVEMKSLLKKTYLGYHTWGASFHET